MILNAINITLAIIEAFVWIFHACLFLLPCWGTKYLITKEGLQLPKQWWMIIWKFMGHLLLSCLMVIFFLGGNNDDQTGESSFSFNVELMLTAFIVIFIATLIGFCWGYKINRDRRMKEIDIVD